jgi:hypothetical protein
MSVEALAGGGEVQSGMIYSMITTRGISFYPGLIKLTACVNMVL